MKSSNPSCTFNVIHRPPQLLSMVLILIKVFIQPQFLEDLRTLLCPQHAEQCLNHRRCSIHNC